MKRKVKSQVLLSEGFQHSLCQAGFIKRTGYLIIFPFSKSVGSGS